MNIKRWLISVLILGVTIASLGFMKFTQIQAAIAFGESFPEPSASVKSSYVERIEYSKKSKVIGQLQAKRTLDIRNEYAGLIVKINYQPGDFVTQDQILFELDTSIERANLAAANARLTLAKSTQTRLAKLLAQKRVSPDQVDQADADVTIAKAEIANLTAVIDKKTIRAPFNGQIGLTQYQPGQLLDVNTLLTSLVALDNTIWVDFKLPQTLPQLIVGDEVNIRIVSTNISESELLMAKVIAKSATIDVSARQLAYRAELKNSQQKLHHNQMVSVVVSTPSNQVLAVPSNAIARNHLGAFVFTLSQDDTKNWRAKSIQVELGERQGDLQIITNGLAGHEFIATEGAFKLKDQLLVYTQVPADTSLKGE
ncbi:efflux RND transporter periplasmic adaptor subunit [Pseudoalteromonas sp. MMG005]|uniref:efflux RND transporter periplasmic adaptor subunit n=1 Tax=Pseudoalteromonas sp. MMG005 TaxID=2822682 RepID=UPI001B3A5028|nr:efflux RND transporter periplasmic adaptor subunit [Pseudoalteromonas sp. MMG005]MBQ4845373.1 efflux RND transporter periplasmic adaptor subunit [Pseudoalteromonas sp. MMG005]